MQHVAARHWVRPRRRVVWFAVAEARGHLMRAHLARALLAAIDIDVEIATTTPAGVDFARAMGSPATLVPSEFRLVYDARQNLARWHTRAIATRYLASRAGCRRDLAALADLARDADLVIDDSLHPALLVASLANTALGRKVVHVHCENVRLAVEEIGGNGAMSLLVRAALARARRFEISLAEHASGFDSTGAATLPPLVAQPRPRAAVRAERGLGARDRFAVVYLNPYFTDPAIAEPIERALAAHGYRVHAVGEAYGARPGWVARDPRLADAVGAADLLVSAAGAGAVTMARTFGTPLVALATDQPEQRRNLAADACAVAFGPRFAPELDAAIARVDTCDRGAPRDPELSLRRSRDAWLRAFGSLFAERISP